MHWARLNEKTLVQQDNVDWHIWLQFDTSYSDSNNANLIARCHCDIRQIELYDVWHADLRELRANFSSQQNWRATATCRTTRFTFA